LLIFPIASIASPVSSGLHADMERALKDNGLTGAVWAAVTPDGAIAVDAAGVKDARTGEPLSSDDRIHIGSVTKTLLAAGVLRLVSEDRLALDTPIAQFLPHLVFDNPWETSEPIRLRHLLDHTSGLDDARLWQIFSLKPEADTPLAEGFAGNPALLRVRSRPGSRLSYSNMGYALLGMVIESVTGERYERYLDVHLLQPLAMRDSSFSFVSQVGPKADGHLAMGHFENGVTQAAVPLYLRPATQFTTTAKDMALFSRFLMSDGRINAEAFIDTALLRAMGQPFGTEAAQAGLPAGYGLGLGRHDRHGVVGRCHSGTTVGFRARLCLFPDQQKAFFVAMNADSETADYGRFDALLVKALDLDADLPAKRGTPPDDIAAWQGLYIPAPNRLASFAWLDTVFNFVHVSWNGAHLQLRSLQSEDRALVPAGGLLFRATDRATTSHVFLRASDGRRILSDGFQSYEQVSVVKIALLWASLCAGMLGLLFILLRGLVRLLLRRLTPGTFVPFLAVLALLLPVPFFLRQSFLQLGDVTAASVSLAVVTTTLPLGMLIGLVLQFRSRASGVMAAADVVAMLAVLQWMIVLAAWHLVPLRLWH
jgi:CubicO group peptidase (beta-lactamase class C family)